MEALRLELGRILGRTSFPAGPAELIRVLRDLHAPDALVEPLEGLPRKARYESAHQLAEAVVHAQGESGGGAARPPADGTESPHDRDT